MIFVVVFCDCLFPPPPIFLSFYFNYILSTWTPFEHFITNVNFLCLFFVFSLLWMSVDVLSGIKQEVCQGGKYTPTPLHTHTHTHPHTHTHTHTHTRTPPPTTHTHTHTHTHAPHPPHTTRTHTNIHHTNVPPTHHPHTHTHAHPQHTCARAHTHTHARTHAITMIWKLVQEQFRALSSTVRPEVTRCTEFPKTNFFHFFKF